MKVIPNLNYSPGYSNSNKNSVVNNSISKYEATARPAFKGAPKSFQDYTVKFFNKVNGSFFLNFLIVDAVSMIIPRILVGLGRDKDKLGHPNYKAAAEEAGREITSGPSMFLIPLAISSLIKKGLPATNLKSGTINEFSDVFDKAVSQVDDISMLKDKKAMSKKMAEQLFENAFAEHDFKSDKLKNVYKSKFVEVIHAKNTDESYSFVKRMFKSNKDATGSFEALVAKINSKFAKGTTMDAEMLTLGKNLSTNPEQKNVKSIKLSASELYADFRSYTDDVIEKVTNKEMTKDSIDKAKTEAKSLVEKIKNKRLAAKFATGVGAFLAVGGFLLYLPKLYQQKGLSPAQESALRAIEEAKKEGGAKNENI